MSGAFCTIRAALARFRERIGAIYETAWVFSPQPEHLFAYTEGGDEAPVPVEYPWPLPAYSPFSVMLPICGSTLSPSGDGALLAAVLGSDEWDDRSSRHRGLN
jgi:hypothetical protein